MPEKDGRFFIQDPKMSFYIGIAAGIGVLTTIGFILLLFNYFDSDGAITNRAANTGSNNKIAIEPSKPSGQAQAGGEVVIAVTDADYIRGNPNAPVTIIEFSDFQCPFCQRFHPTIKRALEEYGDDVRWVYKHFPLDSIHPQARPAANAAECAGEQGKFWEFGDELFANQSRLGEAYYKELARDLGLNGSQFDGCVDSEKYASKVQSDYVEGQSVGVQGTPASFINGRLISGAQPYNSLKAAIDSFL